MAKRVPVSISAARKQLFQLADLLRKSSEDTAVVLEQRGGVESIVMVREARLAYLESQVDDASRAGRTPFRLAGSLASTLDEDALDQLLKDLRNAWTPSGSAAAPSRSRRSAVKRRR